MSKRERAANPRMISQSDLRRKGGDCMTSAACLKARRIAEAGRKVSFFEGPQAGDILQEPGQPFSRSRTLFMTRGSGLAVTARIKTRGNV